MKSKLIYLVVFLCFLFGVTSTNAQTRTKSAKPVVVNQQKSSAKVKKDGTPDMRYKQNKDAAKPAPKGPTKKDGTPDMRFKENKKVEKKTPSKK
jgi:hypothetical protein